MGCRHWADTLWSRTTRSPAPHPLRTHFFSTHLVQIISPSYNPLNSSRIKEKQHKFYKTPLLFKWLLYITLTPEKYAKLVINGVIVHCYPVSRHHVFDIVKLWIVKSHIWYPVMYKFPHSRYRHFLCCADVCTFVWDNLASAHLLYSEWF